MCKAQHLRECQVIISVYDPYTTIHMPLPPRVYRARELEMAVPGDRERIVRLETRAREAETAIRQLRSYIELLKKKSGEFCTQL